MLLVNQDKERNITKKITETFSDSAASCPQSTSTHTTYNEEFIAEVDSRIELIFYKDATNGLHGKSIETDERWMFVPLIKGAAGMRSSIHLQQDMKRKAKSLNANLIRSPSSLAKNKQQF